MGCDFSFIHAADLHLGSRLKHLSDTDPELRTRIYESIFESFSRIVDAGIRQSDFMVISGDLYDEAFMTPRTKHRFCLEAERYGKPVFIVRGNHDFGDSWEDTIPYPKNVILLPAEPRTMRMSIRGRNVDVTGASYTEWHTTENLAKKLRGSPDAYTVAVLHCSLKEIADSGDYAPCSVNDLMGRNIDYWALGHIHKRTVVREQKPAVVYPGNIQGRHTGESGEKGCYLVSVTGDSTELTFIPTQGVVFDGITADITGKTSVQELISPVDAAPGSVVSITFTGMGPLDAAIRADPQGTAGTIGKAKGYRASVEAVRTIPEIDLSRVREGETLMSEIVRTADSMFSKSDEEIVELLCKGPAPDIKDDVMALVREGTFRQILEEAEMELLSRIEGGSE
jgi:DNA repair exonuclease SbcCD nuclease subunit